MLLKSETDYLTAHCAQETSGFDQGLPEEEEVWREFKKGSKLAYSRIYRRYVNVLYNYGFKFIRDKSLVEDCIQDLFVELWESKARLSDTCSIKFYLMKALRIKIFRALKKQGPSGKIDPLLSYDFHITSSYEDELVRLQLHQEQNEKIKHAFSKLPVRQKEAVFCLAGVAQNEIADSRPYCEIIRQWSTFHPEFAYLPRKFKIAVCGTTTDQAATQVHDIGVFMVRNEAGELGFRVLVGGGLGRTPVVGKEIRSFLPEKHLLSYLEAILRVYNQLGAFFAMAHVTSSMQPGMLFMYHGWDPMMFKDRNNFGAVIPTAGLIKPTSLVSGYGHLTYRPLAWEPNHTFADFTCDFEKEGAG